MSDVAIPLDGEYDSRLAAEEAGKDALAAMARDNRGGPDPTGLLDV